jgi:sialate O-acetylesterase
MVLQRGRRNTIWGWDRPGQAIEVRIDGGAEPIMVRAVAGAGDGAFRARLPELPEGGAYRVRVAGSSEQVLDDVAVGEVWLASGQSNMEWTVAQSAFAEEEIRAAQQPRVRWLRVARVPSRAPARTVEASWQVVHPRNVGAMTAVGYTFARELAKRLQTAVGLIDASWGGTPIEAWTSAEALRPSMPEIDATLADLDAAERDVDRIRAEHADRVARWERVALPADPGDRGLELGWHRPSLDDSHWSEMQLPGFWQAEGLKCNGVVWFRRRVDLPEDRAGRDLTLELGAIDDFDETYFNGERIGGHPKGTPGAHQIRRRYRVPGRLVRPGVNVIAVRVFDHGGQGGFGGPADAMSLGTEAAGAARVPLDGPWRYALAHRIDLVGPDAWRSFPSTPPVLAPQCAPGALYGGMIAPLVPFGLRGMLFYQGESNVEAHASYRARMVTLMRDLRTRFGQGQFPFYFVQLAAFRESPAWAHLREAQAQATAEPASGMVTAIDIGDPGDIHPANKREVGKRLALLALRETYALTDVEAAGPRLARVDVAVGTDRDDEVRVHFANARGLKTCDGGARVRGFELAGEDLTFADAEAHIDGETIVARSAAIPRPVAVRYAFRDCPEVNLVNGADLPAEPFRTDGESPLA